MAAQPNVAPIQSLPTEILDLVFDIIEEPFRPRIQSDPLYPLARSTLINCQQVCRFFRALARPRLFRSVRIDSGLRMGPKSQASTEALLAFEEGTLEEIHTLAFHCRPFPGRALEEKEDAVGSVLRILLDLAIHRSGRLEEVAVMSFGGGMVRSWCDITEKLRECLTSVCTTDRVKKLHMYGFADIPFHLFSRTTLTDLVVDSCAVCYSPLDPSPSKALTEVDQLHLPECVNSATETQNRLQTLSVIPKGIHGYNSSDILFIRTIGARAEVLELRVEACLPGADYATYVSNTRTAVSINSFSGPPTFHRLRRLYIQMELAERFEAADRDFALGINNCRGCFDLLEGFSASLPTRTPALEEIRIKFSLLITSMGPNSIQSMLPTGWEIQDWQKFDEGMLHVLQTRSRGSVEDVRLRLHLAISYELIIWLSAGEAPVVEPPFDNVAVWWESKMPRVELTHVLRRTMLAFPGCISKEETFRVETLRF